MGSTGKKQEQDPWLEGVQGEGKALLIAFLMIARLFLERRAGQGGTSPNSEGNRPERMSPTEAAEPESGGHSSLLHWHWSLTAGSCGCHRPHGPSSAPWTQQCPFLQWLTAREAQRSVRPTGRGERRQKKWHHPCTLSGVQRG